MDSIDSQTSTSPSSTRVHILRHGQALHNVDRDFKYRDPCLTELGTKQAMNVELPAKPDLILVSPMTRTIQTAKLVFHDFLRRTQSNHPPVKMEIWPDLREAHDAVCNQGVARKELSDRFPDMDFSACPREWNYPPHSVEDATARAERVRQAVRAVSDLGTYKNIFIVTHRGFISFLVQGDRFDVCECRSYRFAMEREFQPERWGVNADTNTEQDFGPTVLEAAMSSISTEK